MSYLPLMLPTCLSYPFLLSITLLRNHQNAVFTLMLGTYFVVQGFCWFLLLFVCLLAWLIGSFGGDNAGLSAWIIFNCFFLPTEI